MIHNDTVNLLRGYLDAQQYGPGRQISPVIPVFVTLSRETGVGGTAIGELLRDRLQADDAPDAKPWLFVDRDLLARVIEEHNLPKDIASVMDQSQYHHVLKWIDELMGQYLSWSTLARKTGQTILHLARMGNVILVGRGANILTRSLPGGVHVRLVGALPGRIARVCEYFQLTREEARRYIAREDASRAMYLKDLFGVNIGDPHLYDLTINADQLTFADVVALIASTVDRVRRRLAAAPEGGSGRTPAVAAGVAG